MKSRFSFAEQFECRCLLTAGALDTTFSDDGILIDQFFDGAFRGGSQFVTLSDNSFYVVGDGTIFRYLANGQLDGTFSSDGMAGFAAGLERVPAVISDAAVQADGRLILVGQIYPGPGGVNVSTPQEVVLRRFNVDGSVDATFGTNGLLKPSLTSAASVAVRSDGKIIVTGTVGSGASLEGAIARFNADGTPDVGFDGDGLRASLPTGLGDVVLQTDLKMVVQGNGKLYRFIEDGAFDTTFDGDGELLSATTMFALQADDRIVSIGTTTVGGTSDFAVYRYNIDGTADTSFDGDGLSITDFGGAETANTVSILPNGSIFVSGAGAALSSVFAMYHSDGSLSSTFSGDGKQTSTSSWHTSSHRADGSLLLMRRFQTLGSQIKPPGRTMYYQEESFENLEVSALKNDGTSESTFGVNGSVTMPLGMGVDEANAIALQPDGKIVVASEVQGFGFTDFGVSRYHANGVLDQAFGINGRVTLPLGISYDEARDIAIQSDGKIVVVGTSDNRFLVVRLNTDGTLDSTFDGDGIVTTAIGSSTIASAEAVGIQADGKIVVGGWRNQSILVDQFTGRSAALVRYNSDGSLDPSFAQSGMLLTSIGTNITDLKVLADGRIAFLSGELYVRMANGNADLSFGTSGRTGTAGKKLAIQSDGKFVVASNITSLSGGSNLLFGVRLRRFNANGSIDNSFSGDGIVDYVPPNSGVESWLNSAVAIQGNKIVVSGGIVSGSAGTTGKSVTLRFNTDGSVDTGFGINGKVSTPMTTYGEARDIAIQQDGRIVIAGSSRRGSTNGSTMSNDGFLVRYLGGFAPTDISLSASVIDENQPISTLIANLSSVDQDLGETFAYSLVSGPGSNDNSVFSVSGSQLFSAASFNFEADQSYSIRLRSTDSTGLWIEKAFTIQVNDVNEAPSLTLQNIVSSLPENTIASSPIRVADVVISDDAPGTNVITVKGTDAALFEVVGSELRLRSGANLNFESRSAYSVMVEVDDVAVGQTPDGSAVYSLNITDVNEPASLSLANIVSTLPENFDTTTAIPVADVVVTDDALGMNTVSLTGPDADVFEVVNSKLRIKPGTSLNFEAKSVYTVTLQIDDPDLAGTPDGSVEYSLSLTDVNESPALSLSNIVSSLPENTSTSASVRVANVQLSDDALGNNTVTLTGPDAARFVLSGLELHIRSGTVLNFESQSLFRVTVSVDDALLPGGPDASADYSLMITDLNEAPTGLVLTNVTSVVAENTSVDGGLKVADISFTDDLTGNNILAVTGSDATYFELRGQQLFLKSGTVLDFETKSSFQIQVTLDDHAVGHSPDSSVNYSLTVSDINERPQLTLSSVVTSLQDNVSTTSRIRIADIQIADDALGTNVLSLGGPDSASFELFDSKLYLKAGVTLNGTAKPMLSVMVTVIDTSISPAPGTGGTATVNVAVVAMTPRITGPSPLTIQQRPTLAWTASPGATGYEIWVNNASTGISSFYRTTATGTSHTPDVDFGIGKFHFWVRSIDSNGTPSRWTPRFDFTINTPISVQPIDRFHQTARPTLAWNAIKGAARYDLWIDDMSTPRSQFVRLTSLTQNRWTPSTDMTMALYRAWVRGIAADGTPAAWSPVTEFYVVPSPAAISGMHSTFDRTPTFEWTTVTGATSYELTLRNRNTGATALNQTGITSASFTPSANLPDGPYRWWVLAVNAKGLKTQLANSYDIFIGGRPDLRSIDIGIDRRPVFSWSFVDGAASYLLHVNRIDVPQTGVILTSPLASTLFKPATPLPAGTYRAWVRAISMSGQLSPWSVEVNFTVPT